jgi:uncharacterized protein (TIGR03084 family)
MQQAADFLAESEALHALLADLTDEDFRQATAFKGWTINDVIGHLHMWNWAAELSLRDGQAFLAFFESVATQVREGSLRGFETGWLEGLEGHALLSAWRAFYLPMAERFGAADPSARVAWAGPGMSVRSSITARLMETWAHGQAIYDLLGVVRENTDRIGNIAVLGVNTYGWTFKVRGLEPPQPVPFVRLVAPSGAVWSFGDENPAERIEGLAEEFCQVVTQTRNIADTQLQVTGPNAAAWMAVAQCFAGPAEAPPSPGTRVTGVLHVSDRNGRNAPSNV